VVSTNIPGQDGTIRLTIQGEVWQPVDVKPQSVRFGRLTPGAVGGASSTKTLMVVNNMKTDATLTNVRSTNPSFQAHTAVIEPGKKFELTVTVVSTLQPGNNTGKVEMSTGISEMPTLSVPVSAYVMPDVDVSPKVLTLRPGSQRGIKRQFTVRNNTKKPLKVSDLEASDPTLKVTLQETKPGAMFKIMVEVPAGYRVPPGGDKITFKTDSPSAPVVTIPIKDANYARRAATSKLRGATRVGSGSKKKPAVGDAKAKAKSSGG